LAARRHFGEGYAYNIGPKEQRLARQVLTRCRERRQVDRDRAALGDIEVMIIAAPIAIDQLIGKYIEVHDRRRRVEIDVQLIGAGIAVIKGSDVDVVSAS